MKQNEMLQSSSIRDVANGILCQFDSFFYKTTTANRKVRFHMNNNQTVDLAS